MIYVAKFQPIAVEIRAGENHQLRSRAERQQVDPPLMVTMPQSDFEPALSIYHRPFLNGSAVKAFAQRTINRR